MSGRDDGSAVVEHVLVLALLLVIALGVVQVTLLVHARAIAVASAAEGARAAAGIGQTPADGAAAAEQGLRTSLGAGYAAGLHCTGSTDGSAGEPEVVVVCSGPIPLRVLGLGDVTIRVTGHAVRERS